MRRARTLAVVITAAFVVTPNAWAAPTDPISPAAPTSPAPASPAPTSPAPSSPAPTPPAPDTSTADAGAPDPAASLLALSLADLGAPDSIKFGIDRNNASSSLTFAAPAGLVPKELTFRLELPVQLKFGSLAVTQGDRTIARLRLPDRDQADIVIPLAGLQVFGNWATLNFAVTAVAIDGYCWDPGYPIRLAEGVVRFDGTDKPPATVADFISPGLRKVTIALPGKPSRPESDAVVQLAATIARRAGERTEVDVVALPVGATALPVPALPRERQIIVKEGPKRGLSLQGGPIPALLVSGPGNDLVGQARLMSDDDALRLAVSSGSVAQKLPEQDSVSDDTTLAELQRSGSGLIAKALWPGVRIEIDQTRWGHPIDHVSVHLIGSYTSLPPAFGGDLTASFGDEVLDRWSADGDGVIDRTVNIPDRLLERSNALEVQVRTTGDSGHCGDQLPITLRMDGRTTIEVARADPPVPQGFQSFPQAAMPRMLVGIGSDAFGDTVRAAQIMVGLQNASKAPLATEVTSLQKAIESGNSAVLVSGEGWDDKAVPLPLNADGGRITVNGLDAKGQTVTVDLDPAVKYGSLHAFFDGKRSLLVATSNGNPAQLDDLLRFLAAQVGRWSYLDGRAVISVPGSQPVTIPLPPVDYSTLSGQGATRSSHYVLLAAVGAAVLAAAGAFGILRVARRHKDGPIP